MDASVVERAYSIAVAELRVCYDKLGIVAGRGHFGDYWTRDAIFGWLAAMELGDFAVVHDHLAFLASSRREDGMISFLVRNYLAPFSTFGIKIPIEPRPKFMSHKALGLSEVIDSNPFFVIGASTLLQYDGSWELFEELLPSVEKALAWCLGRIGPDGLASEGLLAGWNDGVYKSGKTLLTNVLFYKAFSSWEATCRDYGVRMHPGLCGLAEEIKAALHQQFFNGLFFIDWIDGEGRRYDFFDANANFLAVLWGVATPRQAKKIVEYAAAYLIDEPFVRLVYPLYPKGKLEISNRLIGLGGYASGEMLWFEPACLFALCLSNLGRGDEAKEVLAGLAELVVRDSGIHEVYERDKATGQFSPVHRWNYRAEFPFARSSSLFLLACREAGLVESEPGCQ